MARGRDIKPGFFISDELAEVTRDARLLFIGLWTLADREGRVELRPLKIKAQLFPYDADMKPERIEKLIGELQECSGHFLTVYGNEQKFIQVKNFKKHQHIHPNEKPSELPGPERFRELPETSGKATERSGNYALPSEPSSLLSLPPLAQRPAEPASALLVFPCDGDPDHWDLTQSQVDHWKELFPNRDIIGDCRAALAWVEANPSKRKTAGGMPKTLVAWFSRAQNRGQSNGQLGLPGNPKKQANYG